jgi:hypothetical protein
MWGFDFSFWTTTPWELNTRGRMLRFDSELFYFYSFGASTEW